MDDELEDEDIKGEAQSLPFVISELLFGQYGHEFSVSMEENGLYRVTPKNWKIAPFRDTRFSMGA